MGWSKADLARRMACDSTSVDKLETGKSQPIANEKQILEMLFQQAELSAFEMVQSCQAEKTLQERDLESIDLRSLESDPTAKKSQ